MKKLGLSLSGGGAKGAYEVGVWKYLTELGLDKHIEVIAGTSVGALNSVLFTLADMETAEQIWSEEVDFLNMLNLNNDNSILKMINAKDPFSKYVECADKIGKIFNGIFKDGFCTQNGIEQLIDNYIDLEDLPKQKRVIYSTAYCRDTGVTDYFCLNCYDADTIRKIILASSSLPFIYQSVHIDGKEYSDGGIIKEDNTPVQPLLTEECTDNIVVLLDDTSEYCKNLPRQVVIRPSETMLGPVGVVMFSSWNARYLMNLGYADAKANSDLYELAKKYNKKYKDLLK